MKKWDWIITELATLLLVVFLVSSPATSEASAVKRQTHLWKQLGENIYNTNIGSVGIGTVSPTQKLEVEGNVQISGEGNGLRFPDGSVQTTAPLSADLIAPAVHFELPAKTFIGVPLNLAVDTSDDAGVMLVQVFRDGDFIRARSDPPFTFQIPTMNSPGIVRMKVLATDTFGNLGVAESMVELVIPDVTSLRTITFTVDQPTSAQSTLPGVVKGVFSVNFTQTGQAISGTGTISSLTLDGNILSSDQGNFPMVGNVSGAGFGLILGTSTQSASDTYRFSSVLGPITFEFNSNGGVLTDSNGDGRLEQMTGEVNMRIDRSSAGRGKVTLD